MGLYGRAQSGDDLRQFLILEDNEHIPQRMCLVYACMTACHKLRHCSRAVLLEDRSNYIVSTCKAMLARSSVARRCFVELWEERRLQGDGV